MSEQQPHSIYTIIRIARVMEKTGMSESTIYKEMARDRFPKPVRLTRRCVGWIESEVDCWIAERVATRAAEANNRAAKRRQQAA